MRQILNLLNCSTFKKAQGRKTQVGWDWEEILLGGSVKIISQGTKYSVKAKKYSFKAQNIQPRHKIIGHDEKNSVKSQVNSVKTQNIQSRRNKNSLVPQFLAELYPLKLQSARFAQRLLSRYNSQYIPQIVPASMNVQDSASCSSKLWDKLCPLEMHFVPLVSRCLVAPATSWAQSLLPSVTLQSRDRCSASQLARS